MKNPLVIYNTLTRQKEKFKPINSKQIKMYSCGPTVYNYAHIGNLRTYIFNDLLKRSLQFLGYKVKQVMNVTDVDDKTIKASKQKGMRLKDFTSQYEKIFFSDLDELNIKKPEKILRAAESIDKMVDLIKKLMKKGYAYETSDGIYFSIKKFKDYGKIANLDKITKKKERIKSDEYDKSNPQDFALWKFYTEEDGDVFWETSIGKGRPGWHIECSAMSMSELGSHFDIHTGAIDLIFPHHTNEIAQSECATGKKFVNYWIHGGFLTMKEGKMSKSLGNVLTLNEIKNQGFSPLDYRYLCLTSNYRSPLQFSVENLDASKKSLERLKNKISILKKEEHKGKKSTEEYESDFTKAICDDLNIPKALQVVWKLVEDFDISPKTRIEAIEKFDSVLGLNLTKPEEKIKAPKDVLELLKEREKLRKEKRWAESDIIRQRIKDSGFEIQDTSEGQILKKI